MKKILLLLAVLTAMCVQAEDYLYINDFEIDRGGCIDVPVLAHFDNYASSFQVDFILPDGVTIGGCRTLDGMNIMHYDANGVEVMYEPQLMHNATYTRFMMVCMERDYNLDGEYVGVAKYSPGNYEMFEVQLRFDPSFLGGEITMKSTVYCGQDSRPWVTRANEDRETTFNVIVNDVEPEDPQARGCWIVMDGYALEIDMGEPIEVWYGGNKPISQYHFIVDGKQRGAVTPDQQTDLTDLTNNPLIEGSEMNYTLAGCGNKYILSLIEEEGNEYYVHCVRTSGADGTDELTASKEIKAVRYYNPMGQQMSEPNGITIVVTEYTDGTTDTKKVLR